MGYVWQSREWPHFTWDSKSLLSPLGKARQEQGRFLEKIRRLGISSVSSARLDILTEEAVQTSAIEGERLETQSVRSSLIRHLGLPDIGSIPSTRAVDGLVEMLLDATTRYEKPLTAARLKSWHAALFPTGYSGLRRIRTGEWRDRREPMRVVSGPVGKETVHFEAPPGERIPAEISGFLRWWKAERPILDGLLRAGIAHFYFVTIHPFGDGNGRIARALTETALCQDENNPSRYYSLSSMILKDRKKYYAVLEESSRQKKPDLTGWLHWFLGTYVGAVEDSDSLLHRVLMKLEFWQTNSRTEMNARQRKVLNRLLDAGPEGFEGGLTTRKYVGMTRISRATAFREISDLLSKGLLRPLSGGGRSARYGIRITGK